MNTVALTVAFLPLPRAPDRSLDNRLRSRAADLRFGQVPRHKNVRRWRSVDHPRRPPLSSFQRAEPERASPASIVRGARNCALDSVLKVLAVAMSHNNTKAVSMSGNLIGSESASLFSSLFFLPHSGRSKTAP